MIETRIGYTIHYNNIFIVNAANKGLHTIGNSSRKQLRAYTECSNNDIVTLIFIALDELGAS